MNMPVLDRSRKETKRRIRNAFLQLEVFDFRKQKLGCPLNGLLKVILLLALKLVGQQLDVLLDVGNKLLLVKRRLLLQTLLLDQRLPFFIEIINTYMKM